MSKITAELRFASTSQKKPLEVKLVVPSKGMNGLGIGSLVAAVLADRLLKTQADPKARNPNVDKVVKLLRQPHLEFVLAKRNKATGEKTTIRGDATPFAPREFGPGDVLEVVVVDHKPHAGPQTPKPSEGGVVRPYRYGGSGKPRPVQLAKGSRRAYGGAATATGPRTPLPIRTPLRTPSRAPSRTPAWTPSRAPLRTPAWTPSTGGASSRRLPLYTPRGVGSSTPARTPSRYGGVVSSARTPSRPRYSTTPSYGGVGGYTHTQTEPDYGFTSTPTPRASYTQTEPDYGFVGTPRASLGGAHLTPRVRTPRTPSAPRTPRTPYTARLGGVGGYAHTQTEPDYGFVGTPRASLGGSHLTPRTPYKYTAGLGGVGGGYIHTQTAPEYDFVAAPVAPRTPAAGGVRGHKYSFGSSARPSRAAYGGAYTPRSRLEFARDAARRTGL